MMSKATVLLWNVLVLAAVLAQDKPKDAPPEGGANGQAMAPTRIVLEEKQVTASAKPLEVEMESGARVRLRMGAQAIVTKFEMSDSRGKTLDGVKISEGEVEVDCPPGKKLSVWVPEGDIGLEGGEHAFAVVKDGWRQVCLEPVAFVDERMTGAKWQLGEQQKARVERAQRCVLITHEKDSQGRVYVFIPAGWIVHTLKGEDLKSDEDKVFSGRGIDELPEEKPIKLPMIVRLDPADAVLIVPPDLPAGREELEKVVEPPQRAVISPIGPVSPVR
ncbi:MAG: hypothetical protein AB1696_22330 [Planctomycetota bacterium]